MRVWQERTPQAVACRPCCRLSEVHDTIGAMPVFDHLGITVSDVDRSKGWFDPVMSALGFTRYDADETVSWWREGDVELILYPAREPASAPHEHGRVGWQHLAFAVESPEAVEQLHRTAREAGWKAVREPKLYPRFSDRYYASFVEDADGIRIEFMHNPPKEAMPDHA